MTDHFDADPDDLALLVRVIRAAVAYRYSTLNRFDGTWDDLRDAIDALPVDLAVKFGRPVTVLDG